MHINIDFRIQKGSWEDNYYPSVLGVLIQFNIHFLQNQIVYDKVL